MARTIRSSALLLALLAFAPASGVIINQSPAFVTCRALVMCRLENGCGGESRDTCTEDSCKNELAAVSDATAKCPPSATTPEAQDACDKLTICRITKRCPGGTQGESCMVINCAKELKTATYSNAECIVPLLHTTATTTTRSAACRSLIDCRRKNECRDHPSRDCTRTSCESEMRSVEISGVRCLLPEELTACRRLRRCRESFHCSGGQLGSCTSQHCRDQLELVDDFDLDCSPGATALVSADAAATANATANGAAHAMATEAHGALRGSP